MELLWHAEVFNIKMVMLIQLERVIQMVTSRIKMRENNHFNQKKQTEKSDKNLHILRKTGGMRWMVPWALYLYYAIKPIKSLFNRKEDWPSQKTAFFTLHCFVRSFWNCGYIKAQRSCIACQDFSLDSTIRGPYGVYDGRSVNASNEDNFHN